MNRDLYEQFSKIQWLMHRYYHKNMNRFSAVSDPHRGQGRVLKMLQLKHDISQKELSYLLDIRSQSLGELLSKLEKGGFIERTPSEEDKRVMLIHLTEKGKEAGENQFEINEIFSDLNEEEQNNLEDYLNRIIKRMEAYINYDENDKKAGRNRRHFERHFERRTRRNDREK